MAKGKIIALMLKDHGKIINILNEMEKEADEKESVSVETFNQFKWELKRHMVVEETAIFMHYDPVDEESLTMVRKLEKEHKKLSGMMSWRMR